MTRNPTAIGDNQEGNTPLDLGWVPMAQKDVTKIQCTYDNFQ